jgi:hypothetical protein
MDGLSCSHYDGADSDDGTGHDRTEKPDLTCVHCISSNPEGVTPLGGSIEWRPWNIPSRRRKSSLQTRTANSPAERL